MRAAVAGAGIAGLVVAIALARRGWTVDIFERRESVEEFGAGIQLSPNAMAVLDRLDLIAGISAGLVEPEAVELRDAARGALLKCVPLGETARQRYGAPYAVIHRTDLHTALLAAAQKDRAITMHLGAEVSAVQEVGEEVRFGAGGRAGAADLLVAADGMHSRLRTGYFGQSAPCSTGKTAWRATLPINDVPDAISRRVTGLWMGPGAHLVHYPLRAGAEMNLVFIANAAAAEQPPAQGFGSGARELLEAASQWRCWELQEHHGVGTWVRGRSVLVGDAAHAMLPSAAQGGAQAIEDAWVLAASLAAQPDFPRGALLDYQNSRRSRVQRVAAQARRNLAIYEMRGIPALARNLAIRALPAPAHLARLDWLYGWKPS